MTMDEKESKDALLYELLQGLKELKESVEDKIERIENEMFKDRRNHDKKSKGLDLW